MFVSNILAANMTITNETTYRAVIGGILARLRLDLAMSQEDVAKAVGVSVPTWSRIEKGENPLTTEQLRRAALKLGMTGSTVLKLEEDAVSEFASKGIDIREEFTPMDPVESNRQSIPSEAVLIGCAGNPSSLSSSVAVAIAPAAVIGSAAASVAGLVSGFSIPVVGAVLMALIAGTKAYKETRKVTAESQPAPSTQDILATKKGK